MKKINIDKTIKKTAKSNYKQIRKHPRRELGKAIALDVGTAAVAAAGGIFCYKFFTKRALKKRQNQIPNEAAAAAAANVQV